MVWNALLQLARAQHTTTLLVSASTLARRTGKSLPIIRGHLNRLRVIGALECRVIQDANTPMEITLHPDNGPAILPDEQLTVATGHLHWKLIATLNPAQERMVIL